MEQTGRLPASVANSSPYGRPHLPQVPVPPHPGHSWPPAQSTSIPRIPPPTHTPPTPPPSLWEQKIDPASQRPYYVNPATQQSSWELPPGAYLATAAPNRHQEPAEPRPPTTEEILYNLLFDNFREMGKAADAAAAQAAAKKRELDVVLADSQTMKEHCASYKLHIDQAVKFERECQQLLPQLERNHRSLDALVLPPSGTMHLQKMSEEQADSACTKALAVSGPIWQLHSSKKMALDQYLRCVGAFAQRKFRAKHTLRSIREIELRNTNAHM
jgi:hypothetical protein